MKYLMLVCTDTVAEPYRKELDTIEQWVDSTTKKGQRLDGDRLRPGHEAVVVTVRGDQVHQVSGGLRSDQVEIVGFDLLECQNMDEAVQVAAAHPMARFGRVEVREEWPLTPD